MTDTFAPLLALLNGTLVPRLEEIQASQSMQQFESERLEHAIADLRSTVVIHLAEIRAEIAACQARLEDILVTLKDTEAGQGESASLPCVKKPLLH